jgi:acetyl-CoA C-acetyltransferase
MSDTDIVIVAAKRTPIGSFNGAYTSLAASDLGATAIKAVLADAGLTGADVSEAIMGQVLTAGTKMNPARQASRAAGIDDAAPAMSINQVCGSGLRAVALGAQQIKTGDADIVVAGGQESMTNAPHLAKLRAGKKLGDLKMVDSMMLDGLSDAFYGYPMGNTAENIANQYQITRASQDAFALSSQEKASKASKAGRFADEITPVVVSGRRGDVTVSEDEYIRHDADDASMAKLKPAFVPDGTVTAANSSGINDGAAAVVLMTAENAKKRGLKSLGRIVAWAHTGLDPQVMGLGPISASQKALEKANWSIEDVDLWELNEAFAAQSIAVVQDLGMDPERVNVNGGAVALGHPIGASGARVLVTLLHEMGKRDVKRGVASLCMGGGMGIALCVERD